MNHSDNDDVWSIPDNISIFLMYQQGWGEGGSEGGDEPADKRLQLSRRRRVFVRAVFMSSLAS